ncbi:MAG: zinc-dependent metalloprotease [Phycisphaerales bacterium]
MPRTRTVFAPCAAFAAMLLGAFAWMPTTLAQGPDTPPGKPAATPDEPPEFPKFEEVSKDFSKVTPSADGPGYWTLWKRAKDAQLLAELPREFENKRFYIAPTVSSGDEEAGVFTAYTRWGGPGDRYVYWKRFDKQLALIEPNLTHQSSGDAESKAGVERVYTDTVVMTVPILTMGPGGGPVIDLDGLLVGNASAYFGYFTMGMNPSLAEITKAKAFPRNVEVSVRLPVLRGRLAELHWSISDVPQNTGYKPREADRRVGFFYLNYEDRAKYDDNWQTVRYATRWHLEKRDPSLKLSPPKEPIVFYIEHTTPVRYRRWVRDGLLEWNKAFEKVGFLNAVEVYQQDAQTGAHMDKDPEDVRYNFIRWTNSYMGYAIGPSRINPETGQILDADIVMDEVFLTGWARSYRELLPEAAMGRYDAETRAWLDQNPDWSPRVRLAAAFRARPVGVHAAPITPAEAGDPAHADQMARQQPTLLQRMTAGGRKPCLSALGRSQSVAAARLAFSAGLLGVLEDEDAQDDPKKDDKKDDAKKDDAKPTTESKESMLDGLPEAFIGPLLKDVIMHEVGHTLGLMHNFKASSIYSAEQINSPEWKAQGKQVAGSVMDYLADNISPDPKKQGAYSMTDIGPYDFWAIEWGYTDGDPKAIAKRSAEPELAFLADEANYGPDPGAKVWDFSSDSLAWARTQIELANKLRARLLDRVVKDGQSWQKAREGYEMILSVHLRAVFAAANWIGGTHIARDRKGDPGARDPVTVVSPDQQRAAVKFIMENTFRDAAFGLSPQVLAKLGSDEWWDQGFFFSDPPDYPVNDLVMGVQATALTELMNPMVLRRIYDNEVRTPSDRDMLSMPELLGLIRAEIWSELGSIAFNPYTARTPAISGFRRNLQREHLNRLVSLSTSPAWYGASSRPLTNLARQELRELKTALDKVGTDRLDPYTKAHLADAKTRIDKALDAAYIRGE